MLPRSTSLGLLLARIPLGLYFAIAGYNKLVTIGARGFADANLANALKYMPESVAKPWLTALPIAELVIGVMLIVGLAVRVVGLVMALMIISFLIAATGVALSLAKVTENGGAGVPFHANVICLGLALLLLFAGGGRFGIDGIFARRRAMKLIRPDGSTAEVEVRERQ